MREGIKNLDWKTIGIEEYDLVRHFVGINDSFPNNTLYYRTGGKFYSYDIIYDLLIDNKAEIVFCSKDNNSIGNSYRKIYFLLDNFSISEITLENKSVS